MEDDSLTIFKTDAMTTGGSEPALAREATRELRLLLHIHLRRRREALLLKPLLLLLKPRLLLLEALLLRRREAWLLLESLLRLAAERWGASELRLLRIALLGSKPLLRSITLLLLGLKALGRVALRLLGITLLRRREALLLRLLTKTHGRLLRRLRPIQGRRRRRGARVVVRNKFLQALFIRLSFRTGRVELDRIVGRVAGVPVDLQHGRLLGRQRRALGRLVEDAVVRLERGGLAVAVRGDTPSRELGKGVRGRLYRCGRWLY